MADLSVTIGAQITELVSGIAEAKTQVQSFAEETTAAFERIQGAFLTFTGLLAGGALFKEAITDVLKLDESITGLQRTLGLGREEALQYDVALKLIGASSSDYERILLRLQQQVRTNEDRVNALGVATRNASGAYLALPEIFQNAIAAIQTYKTGTDQSAAAQELFRRSAQDMFQYMELTPTIMDRANQVIKDFGIELQDHEAMIEYKVNLAAIGLAGDAVGHQIAEQLMPPLNALAAWLQGEGKGAIEGFGVLLKGLSASVIDVGALWQQLKVTTSTAWDEILEILRSAQENAKAILSLAWGDLERLNSEHETRMAGIAAAGAEELVQITLREAAALKKVFGGGEGGEGGDPFAGGNSFFMGGAKSYTPAAKGGGKGSAGPGLVEQLRNELQQRLTAEENFFNSSKAEELAFWQSKVALTEAGSKERFQIDTQIYTLRKALAQQEERDALAEQTSKQKISDAYFATEKKIVEGQVSLGKLSAQEGIASERELLDQKWALDQEYFAKKLGAANKDLEQTKKLNEERQLAERKYYDDLTDLDIKAAEASKAAWEGIVSPVESAISTSVQGIIQGTTTAQQAMARLAESILESFVNSAIKGVLDKLAAVVAGSIVGGGGTGQDFSGGITGAGEVVEGAATSFGIGSLFKGLASFLPALAIFEHGGIVPSAQGGWAVPSLGSGGVLAQLHSNEMVLPADISQGLQSTIAGGGPGNVSVNISAIDSQDVRKFFVNNGSLLVSAMNKAMRNGSFARVG